MKPPIPRIQAPSSASVVYEMRQREERAKAAPWSAVVALTLLCLPLPFIPYVGGLMGFAVVGVIDLIFLVLAIVLFVRGAVARGIITLLLAAMLSLWLGGIGFLVLDWLIKNHHVNYPWPRMPLRGLE